MSVLPGPVASSRMAGVWRVLFVAYVVATAVHIGLVMRLEPFAFDAWNVAMDTRAEPFTVERFFAYGIDQYTHSNPRIGQWATYLAYKLEYFAVIATPVVYLALALAITILGLGRRPSWRRGRDLALYAIALGFLWFAIPRIGMIMFCRAYGANYLYGAAIQLWFLVPIRLRPTGDGSLKASLAYALLGVCAGMSNEHTGPTLVLFALGYAAWLHRRSVARPTLAWAGAFGAVIGFAAIFFAPGQGERYDGLATKVGLVGRLLQRGVTSNLDIFRDYIAGAAPLLALLAIVVIIGARDPDRDAQRSPLRLVGWVLVAGSLITATVFVSPKLGPRFYLHSCALLLAAFIGVADAVMVTTRRLAPLVLLAVAASIYAGVRTIPLYLRLHDASEDRMAALNATPPGVVFTADSFDQVEDSWWFLGDDFRDSKKRELIATYFAFKGVVHRAVDLQAPLGVSDVRIAPRIHVTPASCLDEHGGFELGAFRGLDVRSVQKAAIAAVERLRERIGSHGSLASVDLAVSFLGTPPTLPRPTILLGRWFPDRFEGWAGVIERKGTSKTRTVVLPKNLRGADVEVFIYRVGDEARRLGTADQGTLDYQPWKRGAYWALACRPAECFVIAATRLL
ncbi:MAG: hypothetical protein JWP01_2287 [Myxococcales bacterium]|nr:hypothetical protein [Myxococcales bacterium]